MLAAVVGLACTVALGAFLTGTCLTRAERDHASRVATQGGTLVYCGPRTGLVIRACPFLLAGSGLLFILGALWLGWQERVETVTAQRQTSRHGISRYAGSDAGPTTGSLSA